MVDLQRRHEAGNGGLMVVGIGAVIVAVGVGGYFGWNWWQDQQTARQAASAAGAGMSITRTQARARVNGLEPGTNLRDWTESAVSPTGFSCDTMIVGGGSSVRVWNVCGQEEELVRISVEPKGEAVTPVSDEAADLMTRLLKAAAPEVPEARRKELVDALPNTWASGGKAKAEVGEALVSFSSDSKGGISRMVAQPAS
jgi:hypothetical protein